MMRLRQLDQIGLLVQQDPKPIPLQKKRPIADLPTEIRPPVPLTLVLYKFNIRRRVLRKTAQAGCNQKELKYKGPVYQNFLFTMYEKLLIESA
jgi:hypothetical protein